MSKEYPWGKGTPRWVRDADLNDSDKSFTVPAGKVWQMLGAHVKLVATATVGNRQPLISITDGTNELMRFSDATSIVASVTAYRNYSFGGVTDDLVLSPSILQVGSFPMILPAGYVVRIFDVNAVDAAADDMTVVLHYVEYDA